LTDRQDCQAYGYGPCRRCQDLRRPLGEPLHLPNWLCRQGGGAEKRAGIDDAYRVRMLGMSGRALSFGVVAEAYERFRPAYPVELFDVVMAYTGRPVRTALEIGAGTGKATRLFAQRGVTVTA